MIENVFYRGLTKRPHQIMRQNIEDIKGNTSEEKWRVTTTIKKYRYSRKRYEDKNILRIFSQLVKQSVHTIHFRLYKIWFNFFVKIPTSLLELRYLLRKPISLHKTITKNEESILYFSMIFSFKDPIIYIVTIIYFNFNCLEINSSLFMSNVRIMYDLWLRCFYLLYRDLMFFER